MRVRELVGAIILAVFLALFVFMMNLISAPDARYELGNYVVIADLIIAILFIMVFWGPIMNGEPLLESLPFPVPAWIGIPVGVSLFVFLYVSGLGEILLHANEVASPAIALTVAACILGGATYLDLRSPHPEPEPEQDNDGSAHHGAH